MPSRRLILFVAVLLFAVPASAGEYFLEAEHFTAPGGWSVVEGAAAREGSGLKMLSGAGGDARGAATHSLNVKDAGRYTIWVRYSSHATYRGPFRVTALVGDRALGEGLFDAQFDGRSARDKMVWKAFEAEFPEGPVTLRLNKHENKNCSGVARLIDCLLLTMDPRQQPNHLHYGAQTYVRVALGAGYERPVYIHVFADHFHAPWYAHYALGKSGAVAGIQVKKAEMLQSGERTAWCNLTPTIYQDSGAKLHISARHGYTDHAQRLRATLEFATAPNDQSIVRTYSVDNRPAGLVIYVPPNLLAAENRALLKTDREIAESIGKLADAHPWPTHGRPPQKFLFHVSATIDKSFIADDVREREERTLAYFGFNEGQLSHIGGAWHMQEGSYCRPDLEKMRAAFERQAAAFQQAGGTAAKIVYCELTDEPTGQPLEFAAGDPAYATHFRAWLQAQGLTPAQLLVQNWDEVRIVPEAHRDQFPALYYFSQLFRTRALGDFMAAQGKLAHAAYGGDFPVLANFSDGAVYGANFCLQGVDYFELLDAPDQNAIWGEDWSNGASTYQCAAFNVDLMRAAARERGQTIGHHLIAHAGRKNWDVKLKATSAVARGVRILNNFCYGPIWASHEGGPYWRSHLWHGKPESWTANAAITREIGAVEDLLLPAMPAPAQVALLYSSASDAWTVGENYAHGFDRMHTWLALAHAQMPVDIVAERQAARGALDAYRVCYLTGPHLTRAAAVQLKRWVLDGGVLWLTAGAATRDEYHRPLTELNDILPAQRGAMRALQKFLSSGRYLATLAAKDTATWKEGQAEVLGVKQPLTANSGAQTLATYQDGSAALVQGPAGKGTVFVCGFLPALSYIKPALEHRKALEQKLEAQTPLSPAEQADAALLARSYNPWKYPAAVRELLLRPTAGLARPIECSHALVDAVFMPSDKGIVIPLANYSLQPIAKLELRIRVPRKIHRAESVLHGPLLSRQSTCASIDLSIALENNDFLTLWFE